MGSYSPVPWSPQRVHPICPPAQPTPGEKKGTLASVHAGDTDLLGPLPPATAAAAAAEPWVHLGMLSTSSSTIRTASGEACSHPGMLSTWRAPPDPITRDSSTLCWRPSAMEEPSAEAQRADEGVRDHQKEEEEIYRRLLEQLPSFEPFQGDPELREWWRPQLAGGKHKDRQPARCHHFRIKLSAKKSQASWSHRETPRFCPERAGAAPIRVSRLVMDEDGPRLEHAGDFGRLGALSFSRLGSWQPPNTEESGLVREVAVIRRFPGVNGTLALTSNVRQLGVRLHDKLFVLPWPASTVTFTFSEGWFYVPTQWTEERLFARAGLDIIDITSTLEKLIGTLYQLYEQEERDKKMARELEEQGRRMQEEREEKPLDYIPLGWGKDSRWESPDQVMHQRFQLLLDTHGQLRCSYLEQESPRDMRQRLSCDDRFVLPLTATSLEPVGFVEGYLDPKTVGFPEQGETATLRPVLMVSAAPQSHGVHIVTFKFLADQLAIRLDDGIVLTGWNGISVDIHCGSNDMFLSHISAENWTIEILEWRAGITSPIPCTSLLVQLQRKLWKVNVPVTVREEELGLDAMFGAVEKEEYAGRVYHQQQQQEVLRLDTLPQSVPPLGEGEGECECSLLFTSPGQSDWMKVSEPYVPKLPTDEEIQERKERRMGQLKQVMSPITQSLSEPRRDWNFFMDQPGTAVTHDARLPMHAALCNNWILSDESESTWQCKSNLYPRLACLEWCTCSPSIMLQVYTLELIVLDSLDSCKLDISGFVAIRDFLDGRRNYIFNRGISDPLTSASKNGAVLLPTLSPRRAIKPDILLEFDLKVKRAGEGIDSYQQLIQGVSEHPSGGPFWSRVNELSIRSDGDRLIPMMRVKLAMIMDGVEATIEIRPLRIPCQGIDLRCAARTGWIGDDIVLFDGRFAGDDSPLQFVVATELKGSMEIHLEGSSDGVRKQWSIGFVPKFHAFFSESVDFSFAQVSLSVAWSGVSLYRTDGPPDLG
ncbi:unnamed protein product [Alopecurus aequalis]